MSSTTTQTQTQIQVRQRLQTHAEGVVGVGKTSGAVMIAATIQSNNEQRRRLHHDADVVVVGAGVFGCAVAYALATQGRSVLLLERSLKEPNRIVGELLQPGGVSALEKLGLVQCLEGIDSIPVEGYEVVYHGTGVNIPYPANAGAAAEGGIEGSQNEQSSRPRGRAFHHGRFISQLRKACASQPNITIVETDVTDTITSEFKPQVLGVKSRTLDQSTGKKEQDFFFGKLTIIADGYASKFRKQYIDKSPIVKSKILRSRINRLSYACSKPRHCDPGRF